MVVNGVREMAALGVAGAAPDAERAQLPSVDACLHVADVTCIEALNVTGRGTAEVEGVDGDCPYSYSMMVSGSADFSLIVWLITVFETGSGEWLSTCVAPVQRYAGPSGVLCCVGLTDARFATGHQSGAICVWHWQHPSLVSGRSVTDKLDMESFVLYSGHHPVHALASCMVDMESARSALLAIGDSASAIDISGSPTQRHRWLIAGVYSEVLLWQYIDKVIHSKCADPAHRLKDAEHAKPIARRGHSGLVSRVIWNDRIKRIVSTSYDNSAKSWRPDAMQPSSEFKRWSPIDAVSVLGLFVTLVQMMSFPLSSVVPWGPGAQPAQSAFSPKLWQLEVSMPTATYASMFWSTVVLVGLAFSVALFRVRIFFKEPPAACRGSQGAASSGKRSLQEKAFEQAQVLAGVLVAVSTGALFLPTAKVLMSALVCKNGEDWTRTVGATVEDSGLACFGPKHLGFFGAGLLIIPHALFALRMQLCQGDVKRVKTMLQWPFAADGSVARPWYEDSPAGSRKALWLGVFTRHDESAFSDAMQAFASSVLTLATGLLKDSKGWLVACYAFCALCLVLVNIRRRPFESVDTSAVVIYFRVLFLYVSLLSAWVISEKAPTANPPYLLYAGAVGLAVLVYTKYPDCEENHRLWLWMVDAQEALIERLACVTGPVADFVVRNVCRGRGRSGTTDLVPRVRRKSSFYNFGIPSITGARAPGRLAARDSKGTDTADPEAGHAGHFRAAGVDVEMTGQTEQKGGRIQRARLARGTRK